MSGFEDDFGEMVEPKEVKAELGDLMAPTITNVEDPAADFLLREQEQLGELEVEIGTLAGGTIEKFERKYCFIIQFHHRGVQFLLLRVRRKR